MAAQTRTEFPADGGGGRPRYPWHLWCDGQIWEVRRGADYEVPTENMRVALHLRASSIGRRVRTAKVTDSQGEGLVFQFFPGEDEEVVAMHHDKDPDRTDEAISHLFADCMDIYELARKYVTIERKDNTRQAYAPTRYRQQIQRGYEEGMLVPTVAKIVKKRTKGFDHLAAAGREDLMLESLIIDEAKSYHFLFSPQTIDVARQRMDDHRRRSESS